MPTKLKILLRNGVELLQSFHAVFDDLSRYLCHSSTFRTGEDVARLQGLIIRNSHGIEVGLTYKPARPGASKKVVEDLLHQIDSYLSRHPGDAFIFSALNSLSAYCDKNRELGYPNPELEQRLFTLGERACGEHPNPELSTPTTSLNLPEPDHFDFDNFATTRRSSRQFTNDPVEQDLIRSAVKVALRSPSACNRQPCKVYDITNEELKKQVLDIQNNRSEWRHSADHILVVTSNLKYYAGSRERHCCYIDGGLFAMTLLYALHASGLGTCPLNLNLPIPLQQKLRRILAAESSETFIMLIATGHIKGSTEVPNGRRRDVSEALIIKD